MAAVVEYVYRASVVHRLHPVSKLAWALGVMVAALMFNDVRYLLALLAMVLGVAALAKVLDQLVPVFKGLTLFAGIMVILQILFAGKGEVWNYSLLGLSMGARMMTVVFSFMVFLATTQIKDVILVLTEKFKLPYDYVFMFMTALRFVPTFMAEAVQVRCAQQVRGCAIDSGNPLQKIKAYIAVALPLVLISLKKAERLAIAMETRGYGSGPRTYFKEPKLAGLDFLALFIILAFLLLALALRIQGLGVMTY